MSVVKKALDKDQRIGAPFFRSRDQSAPGICIAKGNQTGRRDTLLAGKAFQTFVDDIAVLQADDEHASEGCLGIFP